MKKLLLLALLALTACTKEVIVERIVEVPVEDLSRINQLERQINELTSDLLDSNQENSELANEIISLESELLELYGYANRIGRDLIISNLLRYNNGDILNISHFNNRDIVFHEEENTFIGFKNWTRVAVFHNVDWRPNFPNPFSVARYVSGEDVMELNWDGNELVYARFYKFDGDTYWTPGEPIVEIHKSLLDEYDHSWSPKGFFDMILAMHFHIETL